jgi:methylated-DNA-[protein]-cysteine S-methyltransferase
MTAFALFDTAIGRCALVWRGSAVVGAALPDDSDDRMRSALRRRFPEADEQAPCEPANQAIEAVRRLLGGMAEDCSGIAVDLDGLPDFERHVLEAARAIPPGETRTYGEIAAAIGAPGAARAVGRALGRNPVPIIVPCHRVLAADGKSGGFSAPGGAATKLKMLEIEGARRGSDPGLFDRLPWQGAPAG